MNKAIFLDRDGVINQERGQYTWQISDFKINTDLFSTLKILQEKGYIFIIITNQGGIAKKIYSKKDVLEINNHLFSLFKEKSIHLEEIYFCPHHEEIELCLCRKPQAILFEKAIARFNIDSQKSYMIGDNKRDIDASNSCGINGILVEPNSSLLMILNQIQ